MSERKRILKTFPETPSLKTLLLGSCQSARQRFDQLSADSHSLPGADLINLAMHCNPESGLVHEPECPARNPQNFTIIREAQDEIYSEDSETA